MGGGRGRELGPLSLICRQELSGEQRRGLALRTPPVVGAGKPTLVPLHQGHLWAQAATSQSRSSGLRRPAVHTWRVGAWGWRGSQRLLTCTPRSAKWRESTFPSLPTHPPGQQTSQESIFLALVGSCASSRTSQTRIEQAPVTIQRVLVPRREWVLGRQKPWVLLAERGS